MEPLEIVICVLAGLLLMCQSSWLFLNAGQYSPRYRWFWAIWGMIQFPSPLLFYLFFVRWGGWKRRKK